MLCIGTSSVVEFVRAHVSCAVKLGLLLLGYTEPQVWGSAKRDFY